jgi:hypothetical protein
MESSTLEQLARSMKRSERLAIESILKAQSLWIPQNVPQWQAILSQADELYYGGQAGGGKTDLILGLAVTSHHRSLILRRESTQLRGIIERSREIIGRNGRLNEVLGIWRDLPDNRQIEMSGCKNESDKSKFQGRPHDLIAFDESVEFLESQVDFISAWARTEDVDQRVRIVYASNPPATAEGRWIVKRFAPWLDKKFDSPAIPGELRYYVMLDDKLTWVDGPEVIPHKGELLKPKSRTFIPARVDDNPFYRDTEYKAQLQSLPEPLRSQLLFGDFEAGTEDNPWQVIPTRWVELAFERWESRDKPDVPMTCLGADVARGGDDQTVLSPRYDNWFDKLQKYEGKTTPDGPSVAVLIVRALDGDKDVTINFDVIGIGSSGYDILVAQDFNVVAVNFAEGSNARDRSGRMAMRNLRAEAYWGMREALDPELGDDIALPPDNELLADLTAPLWRITTSGVTIESKEDIKKRLGRSTDCGDAVVMARMNLRGYVFA